MRRGCLVLRIKMMSFVWFPEECFVAMATYRYIMWQWQRRYIMFNYIIPLIIYTFCFLFVPFSFFYRDLIQINLIHRCLKLFIPSWFYLLLLFPHSYPYTSLPSYLSPYSSDLCPPPPPPSPSRSSSFCSALFNSIILKIRVCDN